MAACTRPARPLSEQRVGGPDVAVLRSPVARQGAALADGTPIRVLAAGDEPGLAELHAARGFRPNAVVLDIMLPGFDGLEVLRRIRADAPHVCMLFLTARDAAEDRIAGITAWGDDCITKPFRLEEVLARLRSLLRRAGITGSRSDTPLVAGGLTMDNGARDLSRDGGVIERTATKFELLRLLIRNPRRVLSKAQILDRVWQCDDGGRTHVAELHISSLRKEIDAGLERSSSPSAEWVTSSSWPANVLHRH